jgi:hypothetical protein
MAVCSSWRVLFQFLIVAREVVCSKFHPFCDEFAKNGFYGQIVGVCNIDGPLRPI